jgi:hypothetical protein
VIPTAHGQWGSQSVRLEDLYESITRSFSLLFCSSGDDSNL